jgi:type II secretory pathway component PulF
MVYPVIVILVMVAVVVFMLLTVMPQVERSMRLARCELPLITRVLWPFQALQLSLVGSFDWTWLNGFLYF